MTGEIIDVTQEPLRINKYIETYQNAGGGPDDAQAQDDQAEEEEEEKPKSKQTAKFYIGRHTTQISAQGDTTIDQTHLMDMSS